MNFSKVEVCDLINGSGIRTTLFVSGCDLGCKGCFNVAAKNFKAGQEFTQETIDNILHQTDNPYCAGLSILGGEPLHRKNIETVLDLVTQFRERFGDSKSIWVWSGYALDELRGRSSFVVDNLLESIDVLVDGRFVESLKDPTLEFRGSSNQRILKRGVDF